MTPRSRLLIALPLTLLAAAPVAAQIELLRPPGLEQEEEETARRLEAEREEAARELDEGGLLPYGELPPEEEETGPLPGEVNSLFRLERGRRVATPPPAEGEEGLDPAAETAEGVLEEATEEALPDPVFHRPESHTIAGGFATLRMLDKMSGAVRDVEVAAGETVVAEERLEISMKTCRTQPPELPDDAFAWLTIRDLREDAPRFDGWMIASAPSVSALDHQRYDVWVLSCSASSAEMSPDSAKKSDGT